MDIANVRIGQRVTVTWPAAGVSLPGVVAAIVPERHEGHDVLVRFDDRMVFGGTGEGWVHPDRLEVQP